MHRQDIATAVKLLDTGLGYNFRVREHPLYHLAKAQMEKNVGHHEKAIELLKSALELRSFSSDFPRSFNF